MTKDDLLEAMDALEADAVWPLIVEFAGIWMLENIEDADVIVTRWREDMGDS